MPKVIGFDDSLAKVCTCKNCSAKVEYLPIDVKEKIQKDYLGDVDFVKYIVCPNCASNISVRE